MHTGRALGGARKNQSGETLVETLITVAVVGIAFVAILGGVWTALRVSDYHRKSTTAELILRNYAETMKQRNNTYAYVPCTTAGGSVTYPAYVPGAPYTGYHASITKIRYLNDAANATGAPTFQDTCPATDQGAQELTLMVIGPDSDVTVKGKETVVVVKRDARGETGA
jgi:type II secretory pathway pseudopilin PulG